MILEKLMKLLLSLAASAVLALSVTVVASAKDRDLPPSGVLSYTMKDIDGKDVPLAKYKGKVLLIVNVASRCGNTPQYKPLETIYEKYKAQGFEILAFPANNFGGQEPGTNLEIKQFCTGNYNVSFPVFSKISVKGTDIDPLYKFLTDKATDPQFSGDIEWNFGKFIIGRNGEVVARFAPGLHPDRPEVVSVIEAELAKKAP
jgi:glutathione peroxidase